MTDYIVQPDIRESLDRLAAYAEQYASEQREVEPINDYAERRGE
jgi:hypothetical protein